MKSSRFSLFCSAAIGCAALALCANLSAQDSQPCSNRTLQGRYAFTIQGDLLVPNQIPIRGVAMTTFDGEGNLKQVDHVMVNGIPPKVDWRPGAGTYSVNPDCTGTAEISIEGRPPLHLFFVVTANGREIRTVVADPGAASFSIGVQDPAYGGWCAENDAVPVATRTTTTHRPASRS